MSMCVLGMAAEFAADGIAVNALWPRTAIQTAAVMNKLGGEAAMAKSRKAEIMADAAHAILTKPARQFSGQFCIDDDILAKNGVHDFSKYADCPEDELLPDFFLEPRTG
jgi:citronellol/citronellal dehydrogenase